MNAISNPKAFFVLGMTFWTTKPKLMISTVFACPRTCIAYKRSGGTWLITGRLKIAMRNMCLLHACLEGHWAALANDKEGGKVDSNGSEV